VATRAEQVLTNCQRRVRAGDTVIKRAEAGIMNISERVQAQTYPKSDRTVLEVTKNVFTPPAAAEPSDVKRYKAAVKAYADHSQPCAAAPNAPIETATKLRKYTRCERAQEPALAAASDLLADWEDLQAKLRRSRSDRAKTEKAWIRTWLAAAPHLTAWNEALAQYPDKC
jgi:hypothetical protein